MSIDSEARELALNPQLSFIVEAPAGSGKTGLLVQRFLQLLVTVDRPESVVAMTFTRKAAAEMKQRVRDALLDAATGKPSADAYALRTRQLAAAALEHDKRKQWGLLNDTGRLQVQTIDSLCATLTRQMPVLSEFGGVPEVVENPSELYTMAARIMLRELTEGDADSKALFHRVALHFDNNVGRLESQLVSMLAKRDQWELLAAESDTQVVTDFCELLQRASATLRTVFRQAATVDFIEIARAARCALGSPERPSDLLYALDYKIQHLLVDEFQDTSRGQYALLEALTEQWSEDDGHTLFLVGDPMQSIYGFREAEVGLFLRCQHEGRLGSVRLTPVSLVTNFRTTPDILRWTQETFSKISVVDDDARTGAVKFRLSQSGREHSGRAPIISAFVDDRGSAEAEQVVSIIQKTKCKGDIAILVRSRSHIESILPALRSAEIPYEAIEMAVLKDQQHIVDLISLTRAVLHLGDRLAWLACLRAPWCGLSLRDLAALAEDQTRLIFDLLSDPERMQQLSAAGRERALRIQQILSAAIANAGRMPLRGLIEGVWCALGGPAVLQADSEREDAETYFQLLETTDEGGIIRDFSLLNKKLETLFARPASEDCRVKVMTIHQAKGLEFDAVIIPQLGKCGRESEQELLVWAETNPEGDNPTLRIAAQPRKGEKEEDYYAISEVKKLKESHEMARLFYVACTRAKDELYLLGNADKKNESECKLPRTGSFLRLIWESVGEEFDGVIRRRVPVQSNLFSSGEVSKSSLYRLEAGWSAPEFEPSVRWQPALRRAVASRAAVTYQWVSDTSRHVGTVVHNLFKRMAREGPSEWTLARAEKLGGSIQAELARLGVAQADVPIAASQVLRALSNTLASQRGRWTLARHAEDRSEWPLSGRIGDELINATVDRSFRDQTGRLWVIDFKNSDHKGGKLDYFLSEEKRRYSPQLERYGTLLSRISAGPIWLGLYFPLLDQWMEWQFAEAAVAAGHYTGE